MKKGEGNTQVKYDTTALGEDGADGERERARIAFDLCL